MGIAGLKALASLKLTVTLFALSIFLIFAGTLAQARNDILWVQNHYFFSLLAWIDFKTFFPPAWFSAHPALLDMPGAFPFPGGFTIGALMLLNLFAAHGLRFKTQARSTRLIAGCIVIALGCLITWLVIAAGSNSAGLQAIAPISWITLWKLFLIGLAMVCVAIAGALFRLDNSRKLERGVLAGFGVGLLILLGFLLFHIDPQFLNPSAMRILWQLIEAEFAAGVLLAGCLLVFRKRAGIVLLHAGVALLIINQLLVYCLHKEEQMTIDQGGAANYASDIRTFELAVIDAKSDPNKDVVTVVPEPLLRSSLESGKAISDSRLPFDVRMVKVYENSRLVKAKPDEKNPADAGPGKNWPIAEVRTVTGADAGEEINQPSAFVELVDKATGKSLGTYLTTTILKTEQPVDVGNRQYEIALRFQRDYKPYTMHLNEVRGDMYLGTNTPRNYSSDLQLNDPSRDVDRHVLIRMNEPLRYGGETFYQSEFHPADPEHGIPVPGTTLQVVSNFGWMIPYIACMIVATGLLVQFGQTLLRFLRRRDNSLLPSGDGAGVGVQSSNRSKRYPPPLPVGASSSVAAKILPIIMVSLAVALLVYVAIPPSVGPKEMDLYACGKLPLVYGGRVQPIDTLARNTLRLVSNKETYLEFSGLTLALKNGALTVAKVAAGSPADEAGVQVNDRIEAIGDQNVSKLTLTQAAEKVDDPDGGKVELTIQRGEQMPRTISIVRHYQPAIRWLLDAIARPDDADQQRVFRIENLDVLNMLGLPRREYYRYSWSEINKDPDRLKQADDELQNRKADTYGVYEKKLHELFSRLNIYDEIRLAFFNEPILSSPTDAERKANPDAAAKRDDEIKAQLLRIARISEALLAAQPPRAVPTRESDNPAPDAKSHDDLAIEPWQPYTLARLLMLLNERQGRPVNPATVAWETIFNAYADHDAAAFNQAVAGYAAALATQPPPQLSGADTSFEAWYMHFSPFFWCMWIYLLGACFAALAWLGWTKPLNRTAFWLILVTFIVHTFALVSRMYISGRPPVTNLYSTAIFIGWGAVLVGLILESVYRLGYGNIVAGVAGFITLLISHLLALLLEPSSGGDTIGVMQAVLDTQFWLATHVTMENLGYMSTYVAGILGVVYVMRGLFTKSLSGAEGKDLVRMIYGTICFGMFFSFVGTVLGGLWADDSWGRFWGWDPKENGALMIVLWNALALHARWDGLVKDRGLAVLAIGGNIVTSWSYFGVNQLGVGLHSYGFTEGVLMYLAIVCVTQLALIAAGLVPLRYWRSRQESLANSA